MRAVVRPTETMTKEQALPLSLYAADPVVSLGTFRAELERGCAALRATR